VYGGDRALVVEVAASDQDLAIGKDSGGNVIVVDAHVPGRCPGVGGRGIQFGGGDAVAAAELRSDSAAEYQTLIEQGWENHVLQK
jgi:hypothetical protein